MTIDDLAGMVQKGFLGLEEKISGEISGLEKNIRKEMKELKDELKSDISDLKVDLNKRVDIFTHKELEFRVEKLEEKAVAAEKK